MTDKTKLTRELIRDDYLQLKDVIFDDEAVDLIIEIMNNFVYQFSNSMIFDVKDGMLFFLSPNLFRLAGWAIDKKKKFVKPNNLEEFGSNLTEKQRTDLASVVEYLITEILEVSSKQNVNRWKTGDPEIMVRQQDVIDAIKVDDDLFDFYTNLFISFEENSIFIMTDKDLDEDDKEITTYHGNVMIRVPVEEYTYEEMEKYSGKVERMLTAKYKVVDLDIEPGETDSQGDGLLTFDLSGDEALKILLSKLGEDPWLTDDNSIFWEPLWEQRRPKPKVKKIVKKKYIYK